MVTKEDFEAYESVRSSGITNMYAIGTVSALSGLDREQVKEIMNRYEELDKEYPDVRANLS